LPSPPTSPLFPYTTLFRSFWIRRQVFRQRIVEGHLALIDELSDRNCGEHLGDCGDVERRDRRVRLTVRAVGIAGRLARERHEVRSEEHTSELQSRSDLVCR